MKSKKKNSGCREPKNNTGIADFQAFDAGKKQDPIFPEKHAQAREIVGKIIWLQK